MHCNWCFAPSTLYQLDVEWISCQCSQEVIEKDFDESITIQNASEEKRSAATAMDILLELQALVVSIAGAKVQADQPFLQVQIYLQSLSSITEICLMSCRDSIFIPKIFKHPISATRSTLPRIPRHFSRLLCGLWVAFRYHQAQHIFVLSASCRLLSHEFLNLRWSYVVKETMTCLLEPLISELRIDLGGPEEAFWFP